jgi:TPR repeat protein
VAARLDLGMVQLYGLIPGASELEAVQTLASGLSVVNRDALAGPDARLVHEASCVAADVAIYERDKGLARPLAPAFERLAALGDHDAALTAGHIHACRVSPANLPSAVKNYQLASTSNGTAFRGVVQTMLTAALDGKRICNFEPGRRNLKKCLTSITYDKSP